MDIKLHGHYEPMLDVIRKLYLGVYALCGGDVVGDVAEFGTWTGVTGSLLARGMKDFDLYANGPKKLHLFDSFEGLPDSTSSVDQQSPQVMSGAWRAGTCSKGMTAEQLNQACLQYLPQERVRIYKGWFAATMSSIPDGTMFGLLHIDCDLYQSTVDVLEPCFSRRMVSNGCQVFFDDWNCNRASPKWGERRAWAEAVEKYNIQSSDSGDYGAWGHKFIVHEYAGMEA